MADRAFRDVTEAYALWEAEGAVVEACQKADDDGRRPLDRLLNVASKWRSGFLSDPEFATEVRAIGLALSVEFLLKGMELHDRKLTANEREESERYISDLISGLLNRLGGSRLPDR